MRSVDPGRARKALKMAFATAATLVAFTAATLTIPWEGTENQAYWDRLGQVWTVCNGETLNVKPGDYYTDRQCDDMLIVRLERDYHRPLQKCVAGFDGLPLSVQAAMLDLSYNVGVPTVCKSTAARRAVAGDFAGACKAMTWFNRAGGKVVEGLKRRRENGDDLRIGEYELCMAGL